MDLNRNFLSSHDQFGRRTGKMKKTIKSLKLIYRKMKNLNIEKSGRKDKK